MTKVDAKAFGDNPSFTLHVPTTLMKNYQELFKDTDINIIETNS